MTQGRRSRFDLRPANVLARVLYPTIAALTALSGCASVTSPDADPHAANAGLEALASGAAPAPTAVAPSTPSNRTKLAAQPDLALGSIFDGSATPAKPSKGSAQPEAIRRAPAAAAEPAVPPGEPSVAPADDASLASLGKAAQPALAPLAKSAEERLRDAAAELRSALTARPASAAPRFVDQAALAAIDALLLPAAAPTVTPDASLSPAQRSVLSAFAGLVKGFSTGIAKDGDPAAAGEVLDQATAAISGVRNVRIARATLCRRVMGFGQYDPFSTNTFLAGRPNRALVYVEVDHFSHRAARDRDTGVSELGWASSDSDQMWAVEVSEELGLWHDADGSLQWRRPEQTVVEVSRKRRRDFYLVQTIDLPETLSVGNYKLKVVVKDKTSGSTDEVSVPIQVVADASGASRPTALVPQR